jgi:hypothetical protein
MRNMPTLRDLASTIRSKNAPSDTHRYSTSKSRNRTGPLNRAACAAR